MSGRRTQSKSQSTGRQLKRSQGGTVHDLIGKHLKTNAAKKWKTVDEQWLWEMRHMIRIISLQLDELELIIRAMDVLESKQAVRSWFNGIVPALGGRPIDLCQTARGRRAVLRELGRIEHGVHS